MLNKSLAVMDVLMPGMYSYMLTIKQSTNG